VKKYEGKSIRKGTTNVGKIPDSVGFGSSKTGGGVIFKRGCPPKNKKLK
jgi:hypothetical protein